MFNHSKRHDGEYRHTPDGNRLLIDFTMISFLILHKTRVFKIPLSNTDYLWR